MREDDLAAIANAIDRCATQLKYLGVGDAGTTMGAVEFLAVSIKEGLSGLALAVDGHGENVKAGLDGLSEEISKLRDELESKDFSSGADELATELHKLRNIELPPLIVALKYGRPALR